MKKILIWAGLICLFNGCTNSKQVTESKNEDLAMGFLNPPDEAKPRVFWWWLEGYQTKEGVFADLVAMKEAGIKGAIIFDAGSSSYQKMEKTQSGPLFLGPEWKALFHYACDIADSLNLEISLNIGSGWNDGGPWVTPELASKKLVWSDTMIQGPRKLNMTLPMPRKLDKANYYKPIAVLAVKLNENSAQVKPLENMEIKAVHSIYSIPMTKNGLGYDWNLFMKEEVSPAHEANASLDNVTDISNYVDAQGNVSWDVPAGNYQIMRFGYSGTGIEVSTHSPGGGGLAIDYMSKEAMDVQYDKVVTALIKGHKNVSLKYLHDDSWELGASNWTPTFLDAFSKQNGYDIKKYLPVLTGKIIESRDVSNRFLYDFRRTIADVIWENHYKRFDELAKKDGMALHSESGGPHPAPIDALKNLGLNAVPMGEFWIRSKTHRVEDFRRIFVKQPASAAHIYGKRFVQAEGPTSIGPHWEEDFAFMKPTLDRSYCEGLNRLVIHTFTHSPKSAGIPGNEYFAGTHFNPNVTWWKQAPAFLKWNSRVSYMLSRGLFVGDVCYYYGDNVPNQVPLKHINPELGEGYDYDVCNSEVILTRMKVVDGRIVLPDGMRYEVLALPEWKVVNADVMVKLAQLVKDGATIIGPKPLTTVGLKDRTTAEQKVQELAAAVWGDINGTTVTEHTYGKGKMVYGKTIRQVLLDKGQGPDFAYESRKPGALIDYIHRTTPDAEIYYVVNRNERAEYINTTFRIDGKVPELWNPDKGTIIPQTVFDTRDHKIQMPLFLDPFGSVFVVFRKSNAGNNKIPPVFPKDTFEVAPFITMEDGKTISGTPESITVTGPWKVNFAKAWGGPESTVFNQLISWADHADAGIKYYSGTAMYHQTFTVSAAQLKKRAFLDLGEMYNLAEVIINGKHTGVWWTHPFRGDISAYIQEGQNTLELRVVNLWPNRIIGDNYLPADKRFTKTNVKKFDKDYPLRKSGLLGPVRVQFYTAD
ncbi:glycoside hydrolase family 2 [Chitinophaga sp. SYP-B3965]|uniref:glycosyl hydrolase n=1 Tax=Chitinophaga sp. SYP-B3965 TaxID=2663120 RepID=UPI001299F341|nr:glycosyl hydrolase [Chitinophaga sp. SYP-B3965]MRG48008.1 glycoside hydrolase family 2 [Chitinophaga sp. SYP-B3965]